MFLTPEKKAYYVAALEACKTTENPYWRPDKGILPYLEKINSNPLLCTMLSKKAQKGTKETAPEITSYLQIAFCQEIQSQVKTLFKTLEEDEVWISQYDAELDTHYEAANDLDTAKEVSNQKPIGIEPADKPVEYNQIERIWAWFTSPHPKSHKAFWETISKKLQDLSPKKTP